MAVGTHTEIEGVLHRLHAAGYPYPGEIEGEEARDVYEQEMREFASWILRSDTPSLRICERAIHEGDFHRAWYLLGFED